MADEIPRRVREAVLRFDPVLDQMTVRQFCHDHQLSTSSFYRLRKTAERDGAATVMAHTSRAPIKPARRYGAFTIDAVVGARQQLLDEGLDHGPWSIWWRLDQQGMDPLPSRSWIARTLRAQGLVDVNPRKRPRSSWRRFQRAHANELWQLDGISHRLPSGAVVTIFQIIDDCTRVCVALDPVLGGETFDGARAALLGAFAEYGMPAAVLTDNAQSFNLHRSGRVAPLETWLAERGIRPISGQVAHPQTQGKTERSHQVVRRWLSRHPAETLSDLKQDLQRLRHVYNHERQHQGLGPRITPMTMWESVTKVGPAGHPLDLARLYGQPLQLPPPPHEHLIGTRLVSAGSSISWRGYRIKLSYLYRSTTAHLIQTPTDLHIYTETGDLIAVVSWPPPARDHSTVPRFKPGRVSRK
jgi:transposase InsO family protein